MRWFWIVLIGFALLVADIGAVSWMRGLGGGPDLVLLFVIFLSLYGPVEDAPISGWLLGLAKDSLSSGTFGLYAVVFLGIAFLLSRIRTDIFTETAKAHAANAGISTFAAYAAACLWHWTEGAALWPMLPVAAGVALWNAAGAPLAFQFFFRFSRRLETARRSR